MRREEEMTGLVRRGAVYWIRVRVPADIAAIIGKAERCYSLKTRDRAVARQRLSIERLRLESEFEAARRKAGRADNVASASSLQRSILSPEEVQRIVLCWFHDLESGNADADRQLLRDPSPSAALDKIDDLRVDETALREEGGPAHKDMHQSAWGRREAERLLAKHGVSSDSPQFDLVKALVVRGLLESLRRRQSRLEGSLHPSANDTYFADVFADQPLPAVLAAPQPRRMTVAQLTEAFVAEQRGKGLRQKTLDTYQLVSARFEEVVGKNTPITGLGRADFVKFRDLLCRLPANATKRFPGMPLQRVAIEAEKKGLPPMAARTVNKTLETLSALFNHAAECDWIVKNHARRLRVKDERIEIKRSISVPQLQLLFCAPLYTGCKDDGHGYATVGVARPRRSRFWVPLIGLYSGMRLNEICQLYVEDIKTADGVDYFHVRTTLDNDTRAEDKRLKTTNARRQIPIHPELRRFGLLDYTAEIKRAGEVRLFSDLQLSSTGTYSDTFQKFFSRFLRKIEGGKLAGISFHWLRHTFRDALREAHVSSEIANRLCGWEESGGMAAHYGRGPSLPTLLTEISKVRYLGLNLEHLLPPAKTSV